MTDKLKRTIEFSLTSLQYGNLAWSNRGQLRPPRPDQMCPGGANWGMFNDLGVYGVPRAVREKKR